MEERRRNPQSALSARHWGYLIPLTLPPLVIWSVGLGGPWSFTAVLVVFGLLPVLDLLVGPDQRNPGSDAEASALENSLFHRGILYVWVPVQMTLLLILFSQLGEYGDLLTLVGLTLSLGVVTGGVGITVAHELGHRRSPWEQGLAKLLLVSVAYLQFHIEHNRGHHSRVATPEDPATARLGESFYRFLPRTVVGSTYSAWRLERERVERAGLSIWHPRNQMLWGLLGPLAFAVIAWLLAGPIGVAVFFGQAGVAISLLELVNYIEHYGLERRPRENGGYEKVTIHHSWNASERLSNWFLFNLQRHSHHHAHALTRYPALKHFEESPQLPTGYSGMILLALIPPLWQRIMDPRVREYRASVPELKDLSDQESGLA